jgi:hypothetical protein
VGAAAMSTCGARTKTPELNAPGLVKLWNDSDEAPMSDAAKQSKIVANDFSARLAHASVRARQKSRIRVQNFDTERSADLRIGVFQLLTESTKFFGEKPTTGRLGENSVNSVNSI